jgi:hypothetical protein
VVMYHHCPSFAIKQINVVLAPYGSLIIRDGSYSMLQLVKRMRLEQRRVQDRRKVAECLAVLISKN